MGCGTPGPDCYIKRKLKLVAYSHKIVGPLNLVRESSGPQIYTS